MALQRIVWGDDITVPSPIFVVAVETGGQVLGAFESGRLVGFTLAMPGIHEGVPFLHSHMTAVLPDLQNHKIGRRLKLAQRDDALARGIKLVEWTFDPLELRNAHFNLVRLGAVVRRILPNCYGVTLSPLHAGLPTDRLVAEWHLDSERVRAVLESVAVIGGKEFVRISLPSDIGEWKHKDPARAAQVQSKVREQFEHWFNRRYVATGLERAADITSYLLESPSPPAAESPTKS